MTHRVARLIVVVVTAVVVLLGDPRSALAGITGIQPAAAPFSWNPGRSLATAGAHLLSAWASDCPPPTGECATDRTPSMGVFVQRSPGGAVPAVWGKPKRVSPTGRQAERATLAADGPVAAVGWVTQTSYLHYDPTAPRMFWIRISTDHGRTWRAPQRLSLPGGRLDYPRVAVEGNAVFAVWTNAETGAIRLASSTNRGSDWTKRTVGFTTSLSDGPREGFAGLPDIGVSGTNVAVVWIANPKGEQMVAVSAADGADLTSAVPATTLVGSSPNDGQRYPGAAGSATAGDPRVAVAYTTNGQLFVRIWDGVTLAAPITVASFPTDVSGITYAAAYGPSVLPIGPERIVVAFGACRRRSNVPDPCDPSDPDVRIDVVFTESADGGVTWTPLRAMTDATDAPYRINDEPSLALTSATRRVAFDSYQPSFLSYRVRMRSVT